MKKSPPDPAAAAAGAPSSGAADAAALNFLGRLAHDLRGPLSPLQTAAYLLRQEDLGQERRLELLDIIDRQTVRLGGMLQELSDWMRAQQSCLVGGRERLGVPMLIELACAKLASSGASIDVPEVLDDVEVVGDCRQLVQMLDTLVSYARSVADRAVSVAAMLEDGRVAIAVSVEHDGAAPRGAEETLLSIPEQEPFDGGLGLRLLIARAVVEVHGGTLAVQAAHRGTITMRVELPIAGAATGSGTA